MDNTKLNELKRLAEAASPGPWRGDRYDGTVKYSLLDANDHAVIIGNNRGEDEFCGIVNGEDEMYLLAMHPGTTLELIEIAERAASNPASPAPVAAITDERAEMEARKDAAYLERNQVVAALAKCFPSGLARTAIEGWSEDWHGCVYIDLPTGQASWHFHDSQAYLFDGLPQYNGAWDGHDTPEKYRRLAALSSAPMAQAEPVKDSPKSMAESDARLAIDGAIAFGRQNENPPPSTDHWLYEYWNIGQQLAVLGATCWDNVTPMPGYAATPAVPAAPSERDAGWIKVSARLPECDTKPGAMGVEVLVYPAVERGEHTAFFGCRVTDHPGFYKYGTVLGGVTHWQPLPAAPAAPIERENKHG